MADDESHEGDGCGELSERVAKLEARLHILYAILAAAALVLAGAISTAVVALHRSGVASGALDEWRRSVDRELGRHDNQLDAHAAALWRLGVIAPGMTPAPQPQSGDPTP